METKNKSESEDSEFFGEDLETECRPITWENKLKYFGLRLKLQLSKFVAVVKRSSELHPTAANNLLETNAVFLQILQFEDKLNKHRVFYFLKNNNLSMRLEEIRTMNFSVDLFDSSLVVDNPGINVEQLLFNLAISSVSPRNALDEMEKVFDSYKARFASRKTEKWLRKLALFPTSDLHAIHTANLPVLQLCEKVLLKALVFSDAIRLLWKRILPHYSKRAIVQRLGKALQTSCKNGLPLFVLKQMRTTGFRVTYETAIKNPTVLELVDIHKQLREGVPWKQIIGSRFSVRKARAFYKSRVEKRFGKEVETEKLEKLLLIEENLAKEKRKKRELEQALRRNLKKKRVYRNDARQLWRKQLFLNFGNESDSEDIQLVAEDSEDMNNEEDNADNDYVSI